MTDPKRPRYTTDYTQKIRLCRGCHNELSNDIDICPICRTPVGAEPSIPEDEPEPRQTTPSPGRTDPSKR